MWIRSMAKGRGGVWWTFLSERCLLSRDEPDDTFVLCYFPNYCEVYSEYCVALIGPGERFLAGLVNASQDGNT